MNTAKGYKLFHKDKSGNLHPLYVNSGDILPLNTWMFAEKVEPTKNGKVQSKLGELKFRGGWHLNDECPYVTHIYSKQYCADGEYIEKNTGRRFNKIQKNNTVWCEVEYETSVNCQAEADKNGYNKDGKFIAKNADLEMVNLHGYYRYKTNPAMFGTWIIAGNMRIIRELTYKEVVDKCAEYGLVPMPCKN